MRSMTDGFVKEAFAAAVARGARAAAKRGARVRAPAAAAKGSGGLWGWAKAHPKTSIALGAGAAGTALGAVGGVQIGKGLHNTGNLDPNAMQDQLRTRRMDLYGNY